MTVLLIDSDIVAFKHAAKFQTDSEFGSWTDFKGACQGMDNWTSDLMDKLKGDEAIMCLTDSANFRYDILPSYKGNRKGNERPQMLQDLKDYLADTYSCYLREGLEADDVMGILSTHPYLMADNDRIIVSEDKDMRTIPSKLYAPHRDHLGIITVTTEQANQFLAYQAIIGDSTDGFLGCPGLGKGSIYAEECNETDSSDLWDLVLDAYAAKGLREEDALIQIRMACILRYNNYDFKTKAVKLWEPVDFLREF